MTESVVNILVVDDDVRSLLAMEALLTGPGRRVVMAGSGAEALRELLRQEFAVILLDVRMPGMDGFETAELIRQRERLRFVPIIFLSAIDTLESDVLRGVTRGAVDYLFKPVVPQILQNKVSVFVDLHRMSEELRRQAVHQSEERFRLVIESLQDYAVYMTDPHGRITMWNIAAERIRGWKAEEVLGQSIDIFYGPGVHDVCRPQEALQRAAVEGRYEDEGWRLRKDGSRFWGNTVYTRIQDDGNLRGFSVVSRDLTDRKRAEDVLKHSEEQLRKQAQELEQQLIASGRLVSVGELSASMAHEFNNPLGIILGFAQALLTDMEPCDPKYRPIQIIAEETKRCEAIVRDLIEFGRPGSAEFALTDVKEIIERTLEMILPRLIKQNVEAATAIAPELPQIYADPQALRQVLVNLCLNAADAMLEGGRLTLSAEPNACGQMTIAVADTGFGIDADTMPKIFQPFFTAKKWRGLGLGLPICERIVKSHGGKIDVESEPGRGTIFTIQLPLNQNSTKPKEADRELFVS
jgi:PAS domain S-box-containing protein